MTNNPIKFGTDGWRGIIAEDFTFENVRICAQATADYLKQKRVTGQGVVIGYDTRFASEDFAAASAEVLAGNGIKAYLTPKPAPTPVVSFGVVSQKASAGIIITASHNPARYNGFKLKSEDGASAPPEAITELEKHISRIIKTGKVNRISLEDGLKKGLIQYTDLDPKYFEQVARLVDLEALSKANLKIINDSMFGRPRL